MIDILDGSNPYIEALAEVEHRRWSEWQLYFFSKCHTAPDGSVVVPAGYVAALYRLATTAYGDLDDAQKANDRREIARSWGIIMQMILNAQVVNDAG
jgi:hypothetical protein